MSTNASGRVAIVAGGAALTGKVNLDPWLIGTGITYKF